MDGTQGVAKGRPFSLPLYLFIVFLFSWPFLFAADFGIIAKDSSVLLYTSAGMIMVTVGTFFAGRFIFRDGFKNVGWRWGKPIHYILSFALAFLLFGVPMVISVVQGSATLLPPYSWTMYIFMILTYILITIIPAFGEEFGFRGYLLPHLSRMYSPRKAVLINSLIWWFWHQPIAVGLAVAAMNGTGTESTILYIMAGWIFVDSFLNCFFDGPVFSYIWAKSGSIGVVTFYHAAYDGVRGSSQTAAGSFPLLGPWSTVLTVALGLILLWKGDWEPLKKFKTSSAATASGGLSE